jgi:hypothetical protein
VEDAQGVALMLDLAESIRQSTPGTSTTSRSRREIPIIGGSQCRGSQTRTTRSHWWVSCAPTRSRSLCTRCVSRTRAESCRAPHRRPSTPGRPSSASPRLSSSRSTPRFLMQNRCQLRRVTRATTSTLARRPCRRRCSLAGSVIRFPMPTSISGASPGIQACARERSSRSTCT